MGETRNAYKILSENLATWKTWANVRGWCENGFKDIRMWTGKEPVAGFCEHCNEPSGSEKGAEFLD